ncbi:MAG TPA: DUF3089 domain-containing protein [Gaiellaceae bacterium]
MLIVVASLVLVCSAGAGGVPSWKAWLCFPGAPNDWCRVVLTTSVFSATGAHQARVVPVPADPPLDCFYLYPTVSEEYRPNSDLVVQPEERDTAIAQASYFSQVCRVFAPMYRQVTANAGESVLGLPIPQGNYNLEYTDVLAAWRDYMAHYNDGRGVVLIGHSEGSYLFEELIQKEFPSFKKVFVGAVLLGGDVQVDAHDRFDGVPVCTTIGETGCILAYSSWKNTPPAAAHAENASPGEHVLCVNPAAPAGGSAVVDTVFAGVEPNGIVPDTSKYVAYHFVDFPGRYTARCVRQGQRSWLLVTPTHVKRDARPVVSDALGPDRGLHAADVNLTLGNLVSFVAAESQSWLRTH